MHGEGGRPSRTGWSDKGAAQSRDRSTLEAERDEARRQGEAQAGTLQEQIDTRDSWIEALQANLDALLIHYNIERPHLGYRNHPSSTANRLSD